MELVARTRQDKNSSLVLDVGKNCFLVEGATRAAVYDLNSEKVFSLNEAAAQVIREERVDGSFSTILQEQIPSFSGSPSYKRINKPELQLKHIWLEITSACNQRCIHCYANCAPAGKFSNQIMELAMAKNILEQGRKLGCQSVQITGGEPTLHPKVLDVMSYAKRLRFNNVELYTNATLLDDQILSAIQENGARLAVSIFSYHPEGHDAVTGNDGSFNQLYSNISKASEMGIKIRGGIVVMNINEKDYKDTWNWWQKQFPNIRLRVDRVRPTGRGNSKKLLPSDEFIESKMMKEAIFYTNRNMFVNNLFHNSCLAGKLSIAATGHTYPCIFFRRNNLGNIKTTKLDAICDEAKHIWEINSDKIEICKDCEFRYACRDCRPLAQDISANNLAKPPFCKYNPYTGKWS